MSCGRVGYEFLSDSGGLSAGSVGGTAHSDDSTDDSSRGGDATPDEVEVSDLNVLWTTPHTIHWQWSLDGRKEDVGSLELVVGPTREAVQTRSADARTWTQEDNPELASRRFSTITFEHTPLTTYFAQIVAKDTAGRISESNIAEAQTAPAATQEIVLFTEAETAGFSLPPELVYSTEGANSGNACYAFENDCSTIPEGCWTNLRRTEVNIDLSAIGPDVFPTAYLEWALAIEHPDSVTYGSVMVRVGPAPGLFFVREGFAVRGGGSYRTYEIPLSELGDTERITHEQLTSGLFEFGFGASWPDGATVRFDDVRIWY